MSNSIGNIFKVHSFGESHGDMVGCVIDGCPSGINIDLDKVQNAVNKRKASKNNFSTTRLEADEIKIVSGLFENKTLGTPITILIENKNKISSDYDHLKNIYRPNHADFVTEKKYGFRDFRGGGRSSIRITAPLVAAGEIAFQVFNSFHEYEINTFVSQIGTEKWAFNYEDLLKITKEKINASSIHCPDENVSKKMEDLISNLEIDTLGGIITCVVKNIPIGIGEPVFGKLQSKLAQAMLSINTVKGFEYGDGFDAASKKGSEHNDAFIIEQNEIKTKTNFSGGIQGGISNGMPIFFNVALKPISSIELIQQTVDINKNEIELEIAGRHDKCAVPRATSIVEAYANLILLDLYLQNKIYSTL